MDFSLFEFLKDRESERLSTDVKKLEMEKGIILYQPPQRITPIFEIIQGAIRIGTYSPLGEEVCYDILKSGDFFGNLQYLNGQFCEFAKTLTPVRLRVYDFDYFRKVTTHIPEAATWFAYHLVSRWCRAENRLFAVRSLDAEEKVKRTLEQFQGIVTDGNEKQHSLPSLLTHQDIADLTGMTRQTVSKVLRKKMIGSQTTRPLRKKTTI